jgi:hypothetical protein
VSGVNDIAGPPNGQAAAAPAPAAEKRPVHQSTSNTFDYFAAQSTPEAPHSLAAPATKPARPNIEPKGAPIFERMVSEWLMDKTTRESRDEIWVTAADAGWAAAEKAVEQKPERHTNSGLPIRERGARLVPHHANLATNARVGGGCDPAAIRDKLSRQVAGVRNGRAENVAAHH